MNPQHERELKAVAERYARRGDVGSDVAGKQVQRPEVLQMVREREQALLALLAAHGRSNLAALDVVEVGCGSGGNLLDLLRLGCSAERLQGIELLPDRLALARQQLPAAVRLHGGDASIAPLAPASQHLLLAWTVFSSLLDDGVQQRLAAAMWGWLRPGGALLWYDFCVDNPRNPDVRGVPMRRVQRLFPHGRIDARRVTLAPPLARAVCRLHPALYPWCNALPWLRTHRLAWIEKPN